MLSLSRAAAACEVRAQYCDENITCHTHLYPGYLCYYYVIFVTIISAFCLRQKVLFVAHDIIKSIIYYKNKFN